MASHREVTSCDAVNRRVTLTTELNCDSTLTQLPLEAAALFIFAMAATFIPLCITSVAILVATYAYYKINSPQKKRQDLRKKVRLLQLLKADLWEKQSASIAS